MSQPQDDTVTTSSEDAADAVAADTEEAPAEGWYHIEFADHHFI